MRRAPGRARGPAEGAVHGDGDGDRAAEVVGRQPLQRAVVAVGEQQLAAPPTIGRPRHRALTPRIDRRPTGDQNRPHGHHHPPLRRAARARGRAARRRHEDPVLPVQRGVRARRPDDRRRRARVPRHDRLGRRRPDRLRPSGACARRSSRRSTASTRRCSAATRTGRRPIWPSSCARCCPATSRRRRGSARPAPTRTTASPGCCRSRPAGGGWCRSSAATTARPAARPRCRATRRRRRVIGGGNVTKVPYPDPYRCLHGPCSREGCSLKCLEHVERYALGAVSPAADTAAIIVEAVQSDGGEVVPPANFLPALRELCDRHGIWLVFDEVKIGLGRTGRMFAFEHSGVDRRRRHARQAARRRAAAVGGGGARASCSTWRPSACSRSAARRCRCAGGLATLRVMEAEGLVAERRCDGRAPARTASRRSPGALAADRRRARQRPDPRRRARARPRHPRAGAGRRAPPGLPPVRARACSRSTPGLHGNVIELTPPLIIAAADDRRVPARVFERALADVEAGQLRRREARPVRGLVSVQAPPAGRDIRHWGLTPETAFLGQTPERFTRGRRADRAMRRKRTRTGTARLPDLGQTISCKLVRPKCRWRAASATLR